MTVFLDPAAEFMLSFKQAGGEPGEALAAGNAESLRPRPPRPRPGPFDKPAEVLRFDPSRRKYCPGGGTALS